MHLELFDWGFAAIKKLKVNLKISMTGLALPALTFYIQ
jgi:hypothetical protein